MNAPTPPPASPAPIPPPPLLQQKTSLTGLWITLAVAGGCLVLVVPILLAILIPSCSRTLQTARRTADASNLRQIGQAAQIWALETGRLPPVRMTPDGRPEGNRDATIHAVAAALAREAHLDNGALWLSRSDPHLPGTAEPGGLLPVLDAAGDTLSAEFAGQDVIAWDFVTGLSLAMPSTTPIAWSRGLRLDGTWDPDTSVNSGDGGHILFLDGSVVFYRDLTSEPLTTPDGRPTGNILETLPPGTRVVGSGPGTLHGSRGGAAGARAGMR